MNRASINVGRMSQVLYLFLFPLPSYYTTRDLDTGDNDTSDVSEARWVVVH